MLWLVDWHARGRTNVIGALIDKLLLTVGLFKTNINADIFYQWTVQDLLPKRPSESVVVMEPNDPVQAESSLERINP